jgi:hypothetical protein
MTIFAGQILTKISIPPQRRKIRCKEESRQSEIKLTFKGDYVEEERKRSNE